MWRQGRLLDTPQTRRFDEQTRAAFEAREARGVYENFTEEDAGRSRVRICECTSAEDAAEVVRRYNSLAAQLQDVQADHGECAARAEAAERALAAAKMERDQYKAIAAQGREAGRAEAVVVLLDSSPDDWSDFVIEGDTPSGTYLSWDAAAIRRLFSVPPDGDPATAYMDATEVGLMTACSELATEKAAHAKVRAAFDSVQGALKGWVRQRLEASYVLACQLTTESLEQSKPKIVAMLLDVVAKLRPREKAEAQASEKVPG